MNTGSAGDRDSIGMVEVVQFKWLMGHEGTQVHVERMLEDPVYAEVCLNQAEASDLPALVWAARSLRAALQRRHSEPT